MKNSEAIDPSPWFDLSKYSILQESRLWVAVFLRLRNSGFGQFVIPSTAIYAVRGTAMSQPRDDRQDDLFRPALEEIINLRHPLVRLAAEIDWSFLAATVWFGLSRRASAAAIADAVGG